MPSRHTSLFTLTLAAVHYHDVVSEEVGLLHVVLGQHHHAVPLQAVDRLPHAPPAQRVQASGGLCTLYQKIVVAVNKTQAEVYTTESPPNSSHSHRLECPTVEEDDLHIANGTQCNAEATLHSARVHTSKVSRAVQQLHLQQHLVHRLWCVEKRSWWEIA